ncbi:MAG: hypothetical protein ABF326_05555 [Arenicellales bacterium]|jgi:hypothetical protein
MRVLKTKITAHFPSYAIFALLISVLSLQAVAQDPAPVAETPDKNVDALDTLATFVILRNNTLKEIKDLNRQIKQAVSESEKNELKAQLLKLENELRSTTRNLDIIASGADISSLDQTVAEDFNFSKELFGLLKPALDEMKEMTSNVRQKSDLREKIVQLEERLQTVEDAIINIQTLLDASTDKAVRQSLKLIGDNWRKQKGLMLGELQAARLQLEKLEESETSLTEASQSYLKSFFAKRGRYLAGALLVVLVILLLSHLSYKAMFRYIPGFRKKHRSFRMRVIELIHRVLTIILVILGPMAVFYVVEDWVLFSLGILILLGISLTLRKTLPSYWHQVQLFLNIGSVREGERILLDGLPWQVDQINFFCILVNPIADLKQRVSISDLVGQKSRPGRQDEPWFPCRKGDWVLLSSGVRGKVIGISSEFVQLVERGGSQVTYLMSDFLSSSPRNLATNFRIKETIGLSYTLQHEITTTILETLHQYIHQQMHIEGYGEQLLNLRVEFERANDSSMDLVVIADFRGELGDLYNRLKRAIQRWCVDACSENNWQIPFPQLVIHGTNNSA